MLPDIRPGNTKILYFFNCLLDGMHTTAAFVCDFFLGVNVVYIILVAACIGIIQFIWYQYRPFFLRQTQKETQKQKCLQETKL